MGGALSKPDPAATLQVVGAGYSRTGTSSLQLALAKLVDGPIYHGGTQIWMSGDDARVKLWGLACDAKFVDHDRQRTLKLVKEATKGFSGLVDIPCVFFISELVELYPDVKFVLNTRDTKKWWESFGNLLGHVPGYFTVLTAVAPGIRWIPKILRAFKIQADELLRDSGLKPGEYGPELLEAFQQSVIREVPADRLLIMDVKEGWAPLVKFLGTPTPAEEFPRVNESAALDKQAKSLFTKLAGTWVGILIATGGSIYGSVKLWKMLR
ncbi:hypothetical protein KJ359_003455 [Pestalotiopsis sp. 9143b]|nr:hypothetical protein KJ359_003455 [Pestalotiopsis sp. 9143b]